jgi:hypothetical protein
MFLLFANRSLPNTPTYNDIFVYKRFTDYLKPFLRNLPSVDVTPKLIGTLRSSIYDPFLSRRCLREQISLFSREGENAFAEVYYCIQYVFRRIIESMTPWRRLPNSRLFRLTPIYGKTIFYSSSYHVRAQIHTCLTVTEESIHDLERRYSTIS